MTTEPKLPPMPKPPQGFGFMTPSKLEYEMRTQMRNYGLQCFEAGRQQGMAKLQILRAELQNIANADPSQWGEDMRDQFPQWAQNRARHALANAPAAKAREITDAEIDALLLQEIGFEPEELQSVNRGDLHSIVRAAIALANGRG